MTYEEISHWAQLVAKPIVTDRTRTKILVYRIPNIVNPKPVCFHVQGVIRDINAKALGDWNG